MSNNGVALGDKACDWRVVLSPECPHYESLYIVNKVSLVVSSVAFVLVIALLLLRIVYFKHKLFRPPPLNAPSWFWIDLTNGLFFAESIHFACKTIFHSLLLFADPPFYVTQGLYDWCFTVGLISICYFFFGLVIAMPSSRLVDKSAFKRLVKIVQVIVPFFMVLGAIQPILFGVGGYLVYVDLRLSYRYETYLFSQTSVVIFSTLLFVNLMSFKLFKIFEQANDIKNLKTKTDNKVEKAIFQLKSTIVGFNILLPGLGTAILLYASIRNIIWTIPWLNILFCSVYNLTTLAVCFIHGIFILTRDFIYKDKETTHQTSSSNQMSRKQSSKEILVVTDAMDEFIKDKERLEMDGPI